MLNQLWWDLNYISHSLLGEGEVKFLEQDSLAWTGYMRARGNIFSWDNSKLLDILQQFTFVIKQKEQNTDLTISNNTNRIDMQNQ